MPDIDSLSNFSGVPKEEVEKWEKRVQDISEAITEILNSDTRVFDERREHREQERQRAILEKKCLHKKNVYQRRYNLDYSRFTKEETIEKIEEQIDEAEQFQRQIELGGTTSNFHKKEETAPADLTRTERVIWEECTRIKKEGNDAYSKDEMQRAFDLYSHALALNPPTYSLLLSLRNNRALAALRTSRYEFCVEDTTYILEKDCSNLKALQRRGAARIEQGLFEMALADLYTALRLSRDSVNITLIQTLIQRANEGLAAQEARKKIAPKVQQELEQSVAELVHCIDTFESDQDDTFVNDKVFVTKVYQLTRFILRVREEESNQPSGLTSDPLGEWLLHLKIASRLLNWLRARIQALEREGTWMNVGNDAVRSSLVSSKRQGEEVVYGAVFTLLSTIFITEKSVLSCSKEIQAILPYLVRFFAHVDPITAPSAVRLLSTILNHADTVVRSTLASTLAPILPSRSLSQIMTRWSGGGEWRSIFNLLEALIKTGHEEWCKSCESTFSDFHMHVVIPLIVHVCQGNLDQNRAIIKDALACLLCISANKEICVQLLATSSVESLVGSICKVVKCISLNDDYIHEAVRSICYNMLLQTTQTERHVLCTLMDELGITAACVKSISCIPHSNQFHTRLIMDKINSSAFDPENGSVSRARTANCSLMLLNRLVDGSPEIQARSLPNLESLILLSVPWLVVSVNDNLRDPWPPSLIDSMQEHGITLIVRVTRALRATNSSCGKPYLQLSEFIPCIPFHALLELPKNPRTRGNTALLLSIIAAECPEELVRGVPFLVDKLLNVIKWSRDTMFESNKIRAAAQGHDGRALLNERHADPEWELYTKFTEVEHLEAQRNAAVALAKLARLPECRNALQQLQGFEILHTVSKSTGQPKS